MSPLSAILALVVLGQGVFITYLARRLLEINRAAAFWQQEAGRNATDAGRWRLYRSACSKGGKAAAERQRAPVLEMTKRLREGL